MAWDAPDANGAPRQHMVAQPAHLNVDMTEVNGLRYRVEDVQRSVTRAMIHEARQKDLRLELLNSKKLQDHSRVSTLHPSNNTTQYCLTGALYVIWSETFEMDENC